MTVTRPMVAHWRLVCLLCGRDSEVKLPEGVALVSKPTHCTDCGGNIMVEREGLSLPIDTLDEALWPRPLRGRPPAWLTRLREQQTPKEIVDAL